jgi:hypothetical protein
MPFHIEVRTSLRHARSFNLTAEELQRTVLKPWLAGRAIELGDRRWTRDESDLRILEGPELSNPELSFGQGWSNAERGSKEVTETVVSEAGEAARTSRGPATIVIEADSAVQTLADVVSGQESRSVAIEEVRERLDGRDPTIAAVILVVQRDLPA